MAYPLDLVEGAAIGVLLASAYVLAEVTIRPIGWVALGLGSERVYNQSIEDLQYLRSTFPKKALSPLRRATELGSDTSSRVDRAFSEPTAWRSEGAY